MAVQTHAGRADLIGKIDQQLGAFVSAAQIAIKKNLPTYNVVAETILAGLLNRVHGWKLVNANAKQKNFPGVDLIDAEGRVSVQVTSTNTVQKLDHTLEQFTGKNLGAQFDRLIFLTITTDNPTPAMRSRDLAPCFSGETDIWNITKLSEQIQNIDDIGRVEEIAGYLAREVGSFFDYVSRQHLYLPPVSAVGENFVGRAGELSQIRRQLASGVKPIVLSGLGGMGKTELAVRFGREYGDGAVYFIRFETSFTATVTSMFSGIYPRPEADQPLPGDEEQYRTVLSLLERCGEEDILIIDNVDADGGSLDALMKDPAWQALRSMKLRLILTTRFDRDRAVAVGSMPHGTLYEIFRTHGVSIEEAHMKALIDAVRGHTLTIDLMARTLNGKGWRRVTPELLLKAIRDNTLPSEKYRKIASDYSQSPDQAQIYQHLSVVFDLAGIPEDGRTVLRCATLLPTDGMSGESFGGALTEAQQDALDALLDHGWLTAEDNLLTIHPVIRLVCREELKPSDETCGAFLNALWRQYDPREYNRVKFAQLAESFALAADTLEDGDADWLNRSGCLWNALAQYRKARELYERHLPDLENQRPAHPFLATVYNNVGSVYNALGDHAKALEYKLKALAIREKVLPPDHPSLATSYNNIGVTYFHLKKYPLALEYLEKALAIYKKALPPGHPNITSTESSIAALRTWM